MATTTNYGWTTPDNTSFVKDGALAIRTLGSSADSTVYNLDQNNLKKTVLDAKGDLIAASAADTPARLAVGANGETLVADSSTSTGLRWQGDYAAGKNGILNSDFNIWQRGTTGTSTTDGYQADRWYNYKSGINVTVSQQATSLQNLPNCARFQRVLGQTGTSSVAFAQMFENAESVTYANQTITISFWARAGANYSATSSVLGWRLITGTGSSTVNVFTSGYTSQATTGTGSVTLTTSWQRFSVNVTIPSTTTQMSFYFLTNFVGTAGTNDYFEVTGVQLEAGSVATAFQTATGTIQGELAACQRYYTKISYVDSAIVCGGAAISTTSLYGWVVSYPVQMRIVPSAAISGATHLKAITSTAAAASTAITLKPNINSVGFDQITVASGLVANQAISVLSNNANCFVEMSAEI